MGFLSPIISQEEFNQFHLIDRELYTTLVMNLWRDPVESMQVIGLWLWLERMDYNNVVRDILSLPHALINELADEAIICLTCMNNDEFFSSYEISDIPLMQSMMQKEISLKYFHDNRLGAIQGVLKIVNDVCLRALTDIMHQAIERNVTQNLGDSRTVVQSFQQSLAQPGLSQIGFDPNDMVLPWPQENEVPPDDRTMFVTFSKGYHVHEWEVREFLIRNYGECIESLYMQEVQPHEQPLYARIVFHSAATIQLILSGVDKAKFTINGKHVWARKFVPKRPRSSLQPPIKLPTTI